MVDQMGGRKVLALIIVMVLGIGAVLLKGDMPPNFLTLVQWVFPMFVAGNAVEHISGAVSSAAPEADLAPVMTKLDEVKAGIAAAQEGTALVQNTLVEIIRQSTAPKR